MQPPGTSAGFTCVLTPLHAQLSCLFLFMLLGICPACARVTCSPRHHKVCRGLHTEVLQAWAWRRRRHAAPARQPPAPTPCNARSRSRVRAGPHAAHLVATAAAAAAKAAAATAAHAAGGQRARGRRRPSRVVRGRLQAPLHGLARPAGTSGLAPALRRMRSRESRMRRHGSGASRSTKLNSVCPCRTYGPRAGACGRY